MNLKKESSVKFVFFLIFVLSTTGLKTEKEIPSTGTTPATTDTGVKPVADGSDSTKPAADSTISQSAFCRVELLASYGLKGREKPTNDPLTICKNVKNNCCVPKDEIQIYENWSGDNGEKSLQTRFDYYQKSYEDLMKAAISAASLATQIGSGIKDMNNCKILAQTISHFKMSDVQPKISEIMKKMYSFFTTSYKGVYCTLCDGDMHQFIDPSYKEIQYSRKFCRDITANTLHFSLYFHSHFVKAINLIDRFVSSCDAEGKYTEIIIPTERALVVNAEIKQNLVNCMKDRNTDSWFDSCDYLCNRFSMVEFSSFFQPNLRKFQEVTFALNEGTNKLNTQLQLKKDSATPVLTVPSSRILAKLSKRTKRRRLADAAATVSTTPVSGGASTNATTSTPGTAPTTGNTSANGTTPANSGSNSSPSVDPNSPFEAIKVINKKFNSNVIIQGSLGQTIMLENLSSKWQATGINLSDAGVNADYSSDTYNRLKITIKSAVKIQALALTMQRSGQVNALANEKKGSALMSTVMCFIATISVLLLSY